MKAIVVKKSGPPEALELAERSQPNPASNEVLIRVKAAGVNRPDILQRQGKYPAPPGSPQDIPGLEVAGIIEALGNQVKTWKIGDQVCALVSGGGYAEYSVANAAHCLPIPKGFTFIEAAGLPETVFTVIHNVFDLGGLSNGETFLVHGGSSGIGTTAVQLAKAQGAHVLATAGSKEKCQACERLGAVQCINYRENDFEEMLGRDSVDVVLDMIGGPYFEKHVRLLKTNGRMVSINVMEGRFGKLDIFTMMRKRVLITGSTLRSRSHDFKAILTQKVQEKVWPWIDQGLFSPVIHQTFPLAEARFAHALMEESTHIGKIILTN
ncbi:MAG: NAD(P)H-quinone oxidoreductase [Saprospiraceae bacterium]|nr:NAD(P)H-quinone oxidoreductase [Saprospiraceae bacterium]